jgi:DNA-binding NarL/FixJ family response regulator
VFEECQVEALVRDRRRVTDACGPAQLALAYRSVERIAPVLAPWFAAPEIEKVGFLPLNAALDVWLSAMRILLHGENHLPRELICAMRKGVASEVPAIISSTGSEEAENPDNMPDVSLTNRELEVLRLVSDGKQNKLIANELGLSEHTVKLHIHHVLSKLNVRNRTSATMWFLRNQDRIEPRHVGTAR